MVEWESSWLVRQGSRGLNLGLATLTPEIGYLLRTSHDMVERLLKRRKFSNQNNRSRVVLW